MIVTRVNMYHRSYLWHACDREWEIMRTSQKEKKQGKICERCKIKRRCNYMESAKRLMEVEKVNTRGIEKNDRLKIRN